MTSHETTPEPSAHPYRAAEPGLFDDHLHVPYRGQTRMRLALSSGLAHARIVIDPAAQDLIAIECGDGPEPRLRVVAGELALSWRSSRASFDGAFGDPFGSSFGDWLGGWLRDVLRPSSRGLAVVLHPAVAWTIAIHGGLAHCELDLSAGCVARLDIHGGCSNVRLALPLPATAVPIRIAGGASHLTVERPAEAGVTLATSGGLAALRLDDQRFDAIGGAARLATPNLVPGTPSYELQLSGGASHLTIERAR